jgi:excisionase family DNA binding protein
MTTLITTTKAAEILGCEPGTVGRMCKAGVIQAQKFGGQWAIDKADCEQYAMKYVNSKQPWRVPGEHKPPKSIVINPGSRSRQRTPGAVGLVNAMREVIKRRPELAEVIK